MRVDQVQKIIDNYMQCTGRGGFITGVVTSVSPLTINAGKLVLYEQSIYITDNCIGLTLHLQHTHEGTDESLQDNLVLRPPLKAGDGVLMICRPDTVDGVKYIILDRILPYTQSREVTAR